MTVFELTLESLCLRVIFNIIALVAHTMILIRRRLKGKEDPITNIVISSPYKQGVVWPH